MNYYQPFESSVSISGNKQAFMQSLGRMLSHFSSAKSSSVNKEIMYEFNKVQLNRVDKTELDLNTIQLDKNNTIINKKEKVELSEKRRENSFRLKYWEIDERFACPIAGMCLTLSEQKQLIKKAGISMKKPTLFEIHEVLVASSSSENALSRKIDSFLVRKFSRETKSFDSMSEDNLKEQWRSHFKSGEYTGIFWYLTSRSDLSKDFLKALFGDIHMSMHINALERGKLIRQSQLLEDKKREAYEKANSEMRQRKSLEKHVVLLSREIEELKARLVVSEKDISSFVEIESDPANIEIDHNLVADIESLKRENIVLAESQKSLSEKTNELERQTIKLESENRYLSDELLRKSLIEAEFQKEIEQIMAQLHRMNSCDKSCPSFDLCKKRVLIVGGISKMESLYRQVVELNGGLFEYHDGYVKGGTDRLECSFKRADIVLCPVNCNSHAACSLVKQLGKKHNKPVQMLAGAGLNAIFNGIRVRHKSGSIDIKNNFDDVGAYSSVRGSKSI